MVAADSSPRSLSVWSHAHEQQLQPSAAKILERELLLPRQIANMGDFWMKELVNFSWEHTKMRTRFSTKVELVCSTRCELCHQLQVNSQFVTSVRQNCELPDTLFIVWVGNPRRNTNFAKDGRRLAENSQFVSCLSLCADTIMAIKFERSNWCSSCSHFWLIQDLLTSSFALIVELDIYQCLRRNSTKNDHLTLLDLSFFFPRWVTVSPPAALHFLDLQLHDNNEAIQCLQIINPSTQTTLLQPNPTPRRFSNPKYPPKSSIRYRLSAFPFMHAYYQHSVHVGTTIGASHRIGRQK